MRKDHIAQNSNGSDPVIPELGIVKRINGGEPILSREMVPYDAECIFNAGVTF